MDPKSDCFHFAPMYWQDRVGSVLVTRDDGGEITPQTIEALCAYNREVFLEKMGPAGETESLKEQKKVLDSITAEYFEAFAKDFENNRLEENPNWAATVEPVMMKSDVSEMQDDIEGAEASETRPGLRTRPFQWSEAYSGWPNDSDTHYDLMKIHEVLCMYL